VPRFLLTGPPRAGKTTIVDGLARELRAANASVGGFIAREVREHGERTGFQVEDFAGQRAMMAHAAWTTGHPVGRYRVDVTAFDSIAIPAIEHALSAADVIIIDELGQMELCSDAFVRTIGKLFTTTTPLVATVHAKSHPVTDELKKRPDVELLELSATNRDEVLTRLLTRLRR
jgi:nucleoside-triphosphatase